MTDQRQYDIAALNAEIDRVDDPRSGVALVQARIRELKNAGREVPDDIIRIERALKADCISQSRGG